MKYSITKLTKSSNENINIIFKNYFNTNLKLEYNIKNTYFIKLLYTLLDRSDIELNYTVKVTDETPIVTSSYMSKEIYEFIKKTTFRTYTTKIIINNIKHNIIIYSLEEINIEKYLYFIKLILSICSKSATAKHDEFTFKIILTDFKKEYPCIPIEPSHINSGLTDPNKNEIILFRKEEWMKVFIHECFHLFCLDFCHIELDFKRLFSQLFPIKSDFLFFETLTEFWARTLNIAIISYSTKKYILYEEFESLMKINIQVERLYCISQMNHLLGKMDYTYESLMEKDNEYNENTNFFCYYVLTSVLFFHYEQTMAWFIEHNETLLQFSKNKNSVYLFFQFIKHVYKNPEFIKLTRQLNVPLYNCNMSAFEMMI